MSAPADDGKDQKSGTTITLPAVPPEDARLHVVIKYRQRLDNRLAELVLLDVARKHPPPECSALVDFPIAQLLAALSGASRPWILCRIAVPSPEGEGEPRERREAVSPYNEGTHTPLRRARSERRIECAGLSGSYPAVL